MSDLKAIALMRKTLKGDGIIFRGSNHATEVQKAWLELRSQVQVTQALRGRS